MGACAEHLCFGQDTNSANAVDFHLRVWVSVGVAKVGKVGAPRGVFGVALDDHGVLIERVGEC